MYKHTNKQTNIAVYRVPPQLNISHQIKIGIISCAATLYTVLSAVQCLRLLDFQLDNDLPVTGLVLVNYDLIKFILGER